MTSETESNWRTKGQEGASTFEMKTDCLGSVILTTTSVLPVTPSYKSRKVRGRSGRDVSNLLWKNERKQEAVRRTTWYPQDEPCLLRYYHDKVIKMTIKMTRSRRDEDLELRDRGTFGRKRFESNSSSSTQPRSEPFCAAENTSARESEGASFLYQKVTEKMAYWNKMRQFGRERYFPRPRNEQDLVKLYNEHKTVVPNLQKIEVEWSKKGAGQAGARHFKYYNVPPLKYWNKDVRLSSSTSPSPSLH